MSTQQQPELERPRCGVSQLAAAADTDDDEPFRPRIIPIGEGEVTTGAGSEKRTEWERNPLKAATEAGAFDNAKLVRGQAALNPHLPMDEQLSPDDIVGDAGTFHYEEGKGPVSNEDGVIVDDHIAELVKNELVDISPDMLRVLGEWDESLADGEGAHNVEQIVDVPRMTILDKGAGANAEIGPAETEALASLPQYDDLATEQLADVGDAVRWDSESGGSREPDDVRYGVVVDGLQDGDDDEVLVAVYQPDEDYESWESRGEQNPMQEDSLETVGSDGVESLPSISDVVGTEQNASVPPVRPVAEDAEVGTEQLGQLQYLRFWPDAASGMESVSMAAFESAADAVDAIDGVTAVLQTDTDEEGTVLDGELFAIIDPNRAPLGTLNEDLKSALDETPFAVGSGFNWVPELHTEYLAAGDDGAAATGAVERHSNQPTGADADPSDPANGADAGPSAETTSGDDTMSNPDDTTKEELREQLAAAEERADTLEDEKETLESEVKEKEETIEEKDERIDTLEDENETLEDEAEFSRRQAAMIAAGGSEDVADTLVESDRSADDLAQMALDSDHGPEVLSGVAEEEEEEEPEEEQLSPRERLQEQLAEGGSGPRGGASDERTTPSGGGGNGEATEEQLAEAENRAFELISGNDVTNPEFEQLGPVEYVRQHKGVDPLEFDSRQALRKAHERNGGEA